MPKKRRARSSPASRLRLIAVIITIAFCAIVAVLAACFPSPPRPAAAAAPVAPAPSMSQAPAPTPEAPPEPSVSQAPAPTPEPAPLPAPAVPAPVAVVAAEPREPPAHPQQAEPRGRLAVILDDAGYSLQELEPFLELPGPLTVAVLPNLPHSTEAARMVLAAGKDLILHCPMEAVGGENPGPGALRVGMSEAEIDQQLAADFASVPGARGMNNHMGSRATADPALMEAVLGYVKRHGLFFVDSRTTAETAAPAIAQKLGISILSRNFFIDDERNEKAVADAFNVSVRQAVSHGTAVVIGHVQNRAVLDILRAGQKELADNGVRLARLEEIMSPTRVAGSGRDRVGARAF